MRSKQSKSANPAKPLPGTFVFQNLLLFLGLALCVSVPGKAQIGTGGEVSAFGGVGLNLPSIGSLGSSTPRSVIGGNLGIGLTPNVQVFFEPSYTGIGTTPHLLMFNGGAKIGFSTSSHKLTPFVEAVIGYARYSYASVFSSPNDIVSATNGAMTYGAGVGVRRLIGKSWGLEPEVRWQRDRITERNLVYARIGLFYRFQRR